MCGIVAYFGQAENPLTRILTGMWSIIYRAPDSTGLGMFGDELEPVRTRKALGSVQDLVQVLHREPISLRSGADLAASMASLQSPAQVLEQGQRSLLISEGLSLDYLQALEQGRLKYPTWQELTDPGQGLALEPGMPGRPGAGPGFRVGSLNELRRVIETLILEYDLAPLVVKFIFQDALASTLHSMSAQKELPVEPSAVQQEFEFLFERVTEYEKAPSTEQEQIERAEDAPLARRYLWRALLQARIDVPADYDRDGVRRLFSCLDGLVMSRLKEQGALDEAVQAEMQSLYSNLAQGLPAHWQTLYRTERALNVYGLAASAVYAYLLREQELRFGPESGFKQDRSMPGRTSPDQLKALTQPVLAHGRWALQSQVTLGNTHPFLDQERMRCACVNGQFSSDVERRVHDFLTRVAGIRLRSENSTEYFAQLWGYYARGLAQEKKRNASILEQVRLGLDDLAPGSHCIDQQVFSRLQDLDLEDIEELAFVQAMRVMIQDRGQVAVAGMSLYAPHRLFAGSHNRPLFVVQPRQGSEVMLVSDVNAALGLFAQSQIQESARELRKSLQHEARTSLILKNNAQNLHPAQESILKQFEVMITPLQGEELLARVETKWEQEGIKHKVRVMDFAGREQTEIEPFYTVLSPVQIKRNLNQTFYETHLQEIPDRLQDILESYLPAAHKPDLARFGINKRILERRFGQGLASLRRLFLVGIGSSYHAAGMAKNMLRELAPDLPVVVLTPVEVDDIARTMNRDRDLVLCLSWSGTTADMVQFARDLVQQQILAVGITEKPFADMALALRRSGGVFPVYSGEEVTVSAVKSLLCMLLGLESFCLALLHEMGSTKRAEHLAARMQVLPDKVLAVLQDQELRSWSRKYSAVYSSCLCHLILDAQHSVGAGTEIALKLEENSWNSMGKTIDFRDLEEQLFRHWDKNNLILVNATNRSRLQEAMQCLQSLQQADLECVLISFEHEYLQQMRDLGAADPACLPKIDDILQPYVDLVFYMQFGLDFGLAQGRLPGEFPRNRAKSVTAGRSRPSAFPGPAREIADLEQKNAKLQPSADLADQEQALKEVSLWEGQEGLQAWEARIYQDLRRLCSLLRAEGALDRLLVIPKTGLQDLAHLILDQLAVDGEIIFIPLDKTADATARTIAKLWTSLLGCFMRVDSPGARLRTAGKDNLIVLLAADEPDDYILEGFLADLEENCLWIGPPLQERFAQFFDRLQAYAPLKPQGLSCSQDLLYAALSLFLNRVLQERRPAWARVLEQHFSLSGLMVSATLNDIDLWQDLAQAVQDDHKYSTALFIGPATGNGLAWVRQFDQHSSKLLEWYAFGFSAHGPLVTVDDQVTKKFVPLTSKEDLIQTYGPEQVLSWQRKYFQSRPLDQILAGIWQDWEKAPVAPFYAHKQWFIPELRADYDCGQDNLILIDATSERSFGQALDELATFGCRFARITVFSQAAFSGQNSLAALHEHPLSHLLLLPDPGAPVSDFLLPFLQTLLSTALAARSAG